MQTFLYRTATFQRRHQYMFMECFLILECNKRANTLSHIPLGDVMLCKHSTTVRSTERYPAPLQSSSNIVSAYNPSLIAAN